MTRKVVNTALIVAMLLFAPSMIPVRTGMAPNTWVPIDAAFAPVPLTPAPPPLPATHGFIPAWFWAAFACPASIILSGIVANFRDNRQLTTPEAWTCGLAFWLAKPKRSAVPQR
jgi:hypothetical protein